MSTIKYAGVFDRVKAAMIDAVIIILLLLASTDLLSNFDNPPNYLKQLIFVFIFLLYEPIMVSTLGASVGHHFNNLRIQQEASSQKINLIVAILRFIIKMLLGWLSLLTVGSQKKKQALHDLIAKSVVIIDK